VLSPNCLVADGDTLYLYSSNAQLAQLSFSGQNEVGFAVADLLATNFPPASSYLAIHRNGIDEGLFISDGNSRLMRFSLRKGSWSPIATIGGGISAIQSVQTATGVFSLLGGSNAGSNKILGRSLTNFVDQASTTYSAFATIGSIILAPPSTASSAVDFLFLHFINVGTPLTVAAMTNEVSGSFVNIPRQANDPWQIPASSSITMSRFDWQGNQGPLASVVKHLQLKVTFASENAANELLALGIMHHPIGEGK
jgi:hypothetical protein